MIEKNENAFDVLREEHRCLRSLLDLLEVLCAELSVGCDAPTDHLQQLVDFFLEFADRHHCRKEECVLFELMQAAGLPTDCVSTRTLTQEHEAGRKLVSDMSTALREFHEGRDDAREELVSAAWDFIELFRDHMDEEEMVVFAMAEAELTEGMLDELNREFRRLKKEQRFPANTDALRKYIHDWTRGRALARSSGSAHSSAGLRGLA